VYNCRTNTNDKMSCKKLYLIFLYTLLLFGVESQEELLVIGRTTGEIKVNDQLLPSYGFTNSLSGGVTLPGIELKTIEGDSIILDFWNISQGDPQGFEIEGVELIKRLESGKLSKEFQVYHMDHGLYHFNAPTSGTYIYYCPERYPFNLQAGMFGLLIVQDKDPNTKIYDQELSLCSFEIDTAWHNAQLLDAETSAGINPSDTLTYLPQYYLINGVPINDIEPIHFDKKSDLSPIKLRLANAGQFEHIIEIPSQLKASVVFNSKFIVTTEDGSISVVLPPLSSCEVLIYPSKKIKKASILYKYRNLTTNDVDFKSSIPIKFSKTKHQ
jgi:FtsP/CotA-like multicopper oxidase with cupredoxin domain